MERPHKTLKIWGKILDLVKYTYTLTKAFPKEEVYVLTSQMRRAAVSIASNIAEGSARKTNPEKFHFYVIARGSLSELDAQLEISLALTYVSKDQASDLQLKLDEISKMLEGMLQHYSHQSP